MNKFWQLGLAAVLLVGIAYFFSYHILSVPLGLTSDEGGFGINAVYLSRSLRDENGFYLPVFALSLNGKEWRQPVTQYYMAAFFKLFGASVFNLRFSSVVITITSAGLMYLLAKQILDKTWACVAVVVFLSTPLIMIQSHLGLDNIMPIPFTILWLLFLLLYSKSKKNFWLVLAGVSLGIGFYTYKGMRATVPVWCIVTVGYLILSEWADKKRLVRAVLAFCLGVAPFFLVIPKLEHDYPNAVFDKQGFNWDSWYSFLLPYISSFDLSFLFIQGDATLYHSTGRHGMMLLASAPLFFVGLYQSLKQKNFKLFLVVIFFTAPLLFGLVNSVHRASRLMAMIPAYVLIATVGAKTIWEKKKIILVVLTLIMILNYGDFVNFYWNKYPELTRNIFGDATYYQDYETFLELSNKLKLDKYVNEDVVNDDGITGQFYQLLYLDDSVRYLTADDPLPQKGIMLSIRTDIPKAKLVATKKVKYNILVSQ